MSPEAHQAVIIVHDERELGAFLTHGFSPTRCVVDAGGDPVGAHVAWLHLRSLRIAVVRVDRPATVAFDAGSGPLLTVPLGFGPTPHEIVRPATLASRRGADIVAAGGHGEHRVPEGGVVALVHLSQLELEREAVAILGGPPDHPVRFDPTVDLTVSTGQQLAAAVELLCDQARTASSLLRSGLAERRLEQVVLDMFLLAADHIEADTVDEDGVSVATPWLRRAVELLEERPDVGWSVSTLSREVSVSARALHHGFRRDLGTTPMGFLLDLRLARARGDLLRRTEGTSVSAVAQRVGMPHLGRFASAYRARYGESPSQTLRGSSGTTAGDRADRDAVGAEP